MPSRPNTTGDPYGMCKESAFYIAPFFGYMTMVKMREICHILEDEEMSSYYGGIAAKMKQAIVGVLSAGYAARLSDGGVCASFCI